MSIDSNNFIAWMICGMSDRRRNTEEERDDSVDKLIYTIHFSAYAGRHSVQLESERGSRILCTQISTWWRPNDSSPFRTSSEGMTFGTQMRFIAGIEVRRIFLEACVVFSYDCLNHLSLSEPSFKKIPFTNIAG